MKVVFNRDYSPRKKGDIVEFKTREEIKVGEFYVTNGIAKLCECSEAKGGCADCDKKKDKQDSQELKDLRVVDLLEIAETLEIDVPTGTKKAQLIELIEEAQKAQ
jgi:hypothetical protein